MITVAFDVDDTLIVPVVATGFYYDTPNYPVIEQFKWHEAQGHKMIIWSGSGVDWATMWAGKLGLLAEIRVKEKSDDVDIAYDDCEVDLAKVNIKVKRVNNSISRKEWNERKHFMTLPEQHYDGRLYTQQEVDELIAQIPQTTSTVIKK